MRGPAANLACNVCPPSPRISIRLQRPRHGVIAGGKDQDSQCVLGIPGRDAGGRDTLDRGLAYLHQYDIVLVVHLIIAALTGAALGAEQLVLGHELGRHHRSLTALADLLPHEGSVVLMGRPGEHAVIEMGQPFLEPRCGPQPLVLRQPLVRCHGQGRPRVALVHQRAGGCATLLDDVRVARLDLALRFGSDGPMAARRTVIGRALTHRQMADVLRDGRDALAPSGPGADDAHPRAGEGQALRRPAPGVTSGALEAVEPRKVGDRLRG